MTPDLTCAACRERLPWRAADLLAPDDRAAVERHLATCADCQREATLWSGVATALADEERRIPPDARADDAWLALRDRLPRRSPLAVAQRADRRKGSLVDLNADPTTPPSAPSAPSIGGRPPQRPARSALALPAAVLLVALIVALFGLFGAQLRRGKTSAVTGSGTPTPTSCAPGALRASLPAHATIRDISMTSAREGWAVGWISDGTETQATPPKTLLMRFEDCQWRPVGDSIPAAQLLSVSMTSAADGWALGATVTDFSVSQGNGVTQHEWIGATMFALHDVNGVWQRVSLPTAAQSVSGKVRMTTSGDGWMLIDSGKSHTNPYSATYAYTLLHYQDGAWTPTPLTFDTSGSLILWNLAAMTPNDCWIVGYGPDAGDTFAVAHYHDGAWTTWTGSQLGVNYSALYGITMMAPDDVWIAGSYPYQDASGDHAGPLALHYDGAHWTRANIGDFTDQSNNHAIMTIAAASPTEVWAFPDTLGYIDRDYHLARESSGAWTWTTAPLLITSVSSVVFVSPTEGFAAAVTPTGPGYESVLLHYDNGSWSVIPNQ